MKTRKRAKSADRPGVAGVGRQFEEFCKTIAALRHPKTGCPWDLKQSHKSLRRYVIEEAYEAAQAMGGRDATAIAEELGDVLLQVVLNAQIGSDAGSFTVSDVIASINKKMLYRHPHVFKRAGSKISAVEVTKNWDVLKGQEKGKEKGKQKSASYFGDLNRAGLPALMKATKIGEKASKIEFDWDGPKQVLKQLQSEMGELEQAIRQNVKGRRSAAAARHVVDELGDVAFTFAQLCRHLKVDPDRAAEHGNQKFLARFAKLEAAARKERRDLRKASRVDLERLWVKAKSV